MRTSACAEETKESARGRPVTVLIAMNPMRAYPDVRIQGTNETDVRRHWQCLGITRNPWVAKRGSRRLRPTAIIITSIIIKIIMMVIIY